MAGQVLDTMFVDVIARGVQETGQMLRGVTQESERAAASTRKLRDAVREAGQAGRGMTGAAGAGRQTTPLANSPTMQQAGQQAGGLSQLAVAAVQAAAALRQLRGAATGVRVAEPVFQAKRVEGGDGGVKKAKLVGDKEDGGLGGQLKQVGVAFAVATAAVAPFVAMIRQGLQGTVELERFGQAVAAVSREMATLIGPPLRMVADVILQAVSIFRQMGPAAQQLLGVFLGIGVLSTVLNDPALRSALNDLGAAFGELMIAAKPLINQLVFLGTSLVKVGIVEPLKLFVMALTFATNVLTKLTELSAKGMQAMGLGITMKTRGTRDELSLSQTGTEDAQASFARIQEAVLKAATPGGESEDVKQTNYLEKMATDIHEMWAALKAKLNVQDLPKQIANTPPGQFAEGAMGSGVFGLAGVLGSLAIGRMRK